MQGVISACSLCLTRDQNHNDLASQAVVARSKHKKTGGIAGFFLIRQLKEMLAVELELIDGFVNIRQRFVLA